MLLFDLTGIDILRIKVMVILHGNGKRGTPANLLACTFIHRLIPGHFRCGDEMPGDGDPLSLSVLENLIYFLKSLKCGLGSGVDVELVGSE